MSSNKFNPSEVGRTIRSCLYDKVLLAWEREYSSAKFDVRLGSFKDFCSKHSIVVKQGNNPKDFDRNISKVRKDGKQIYFVYRRYDSKAKSLFYHLRNAAAHADYGRRVIGRKNFICFHHMYKDKLKMTGQIPESLFPKLIDALASTKK